LGRENLNKVPLGGENLNKLSLGRKNLNKVPLGGENLNRVMWAGRTLENQGFPQILPFKGFILKGSTSGGGQAVSEKVGKGGKVVS